MGKYGIFVAKMGKYGIFVAKFCKYALIDSFQGYAAVIDSSANYAALGDGDGVNGDGDGDGDDVNGDGAQEGEAVGRTESRDEWARYNNTENHHLGHIFHFHDNDSLWTDLVVVVHCDMPEDFVIWTQNA